MSHHPVRSSQARWLASGLAVLACLGTTLPSAATAARVEVSSRPTHVNTSHGPQSDVAAGVRVKEDRTFAGPDLDNTRRLTPAARRLAAAAPVKAARAELADELMATDFVTRAGIERARVEEYVDGVAFMKALSELASAQRRPTQLRSPYPVARAGLDNPDNVYRSIRLDPRARYVITGRRNTSYDVYFQLLSGQPGENNSLHRQLSYLSGTDLEVDRRGRFEISVDTRPASQVAGPHLSMDPREGAVLVMRDTLNNWATESPVRVQIRQTSGPRGALTSVPTDDQVAAVVRRTREAVRFWHAYTGQMLRVPANAMLRPAPAVGGLPGQVNTSGRFVLGPDEALVLTVDPQGADYLGLQLGDHLFASTNYWDHTSSRNLTQVRRNSDGTVSYVISSSDPGVANWVDTHGDAEGLIFVRWQGLPAGVVPPSVQVRTMRVGDVADDPALSPSRVTPRERRSELAARRASFDRRGMGTTRY